MPSTQFETQLAATLNYRQPEINDQLFDSHPLMAWLKSKGQIDPWVEGGDKIETLVSKGGNTSFAARDYKTRVDFAEQDPLLVAEIDSRVVNGGLLWYTHDEETNSGSKTKVIDFVNTIIDNAVESLQDTLALELWQGGTGEHIHGIPAMITNDNAYMGFTRTATGYAWWKANATSAATDPSGFNRTFGVSATTFTYGPYHTAEPLVLSGGTDGGLQAIYNDCCDNGGLNGPDFAITSELLFNKLVALAKAEGTYNFNQKMVQLGYPENLQYRNATIVWDRNCGAVAGTPDTGTLFLLNSKYVKMRPYKQYAKGPRATEAVSTISQGLDAKVKMFIWRGNMTCSRPNKCGRLSGKTA